MLANGVEVTVVVVVLYLLCSHGLRMTVLLTVCWLSSVYMYVKCGCVYRRTVILSTC